MRILNSIKGKFPAIYKLADPPFSTSFNYQIPGHKGTVGIIAAYTRSFCGTCNRLRLTPLGEMKTCLYGESALNFKDLLRAGASETQVQHALLKAISLKEKNGWEAERNSAGLASLSASMATIGG